MKDSLQQFKADLFKALAHPMRIRILEILRQGERTVADIQSELGVESSMVSQQLAILRMKQIVGSRKAGTSVFYHVRDAQVYQILDAARQIFNSQLNELQSLVEQP